MELSGEFSNFDFFHENLLKNEFYSWNFRFFLLFFSSLSLTLIANNERIGVCWKSTSKIILLKITRTILNNQFYLKLKLESFRFQPSKKFLCLFVGPNFWKNFLFGNSHVFEVCWHFMVHHRAGCIHLTNSCSLGLFHILNLKLGSPNQNICVFESLYFRLFFKWIHFFGSSKLDLIIDS